MASGKRRYGDGCPLAQLLDVVGERWGLLVVRELVFGPKRFSDLRRSLAGIAPNMLTQRLLDLEAGGVLERRLLPPPARVQVYALTGWGRAALPALQALARWGAAAPAYAPDLPMSASAALVAMGGLFEAAAARGERLRLELRLGDEVFRVDVAQGRIDVAAGPHPSPDARLAAAPERLLALLRDDASLKSAEADGVAVEGDRKAAKRFARLFGASAA